jgi:hypothetical protein
MHRLPVLAICIAAFAFVRQEYPTIIRLTWLAVAGAVAIPHLTRPLVAGGLIHIWWLVWLAVAFAGNSYSLLAAAALYRLMLLGERYEGRYLPRPLGRAERLFLFVAALQTGIEGAFALPLLARTGQDNTPLLAVLFLIALPVAFVMVRLSLLLPTIVAEQRFDLRRSWDLTRGNFLQLVALFIVSGIVVSVVLDLPALVLAYALGESLISRAVLLAAAWLVGTLGGAFFFATIASAYLHLKDDPSGEQNPVAQPEAG